MVGDRFFYVPFDKSLAIHSKSVNAPLYAYYFTFKGKHGVPEKFNLQPSEWGILLNIIQTETEANFIYHI